MTDFKVTDEAVSAALDCQPFTYRNSAQRAWQELNLSEPDRVLFVRSVIEAALPVMFEPVGFLVGFSFFFDPTNARRRAEGTGMPVMDIYRIKEPK